MQLQHISRIHDQSFLIDAFVHDDPDQRTLATLIDHVDRVGIDHVGIGLDLCDHVNDYHHTPKRSLPVISSRIMATWSISRPD